ncbi:MAG: PAS domain-containing protein, partial [Armatimonadetes bacterium]|nr:PAS domain-containing protein [Armatimonadota bacterium]
MAILGALAVLGYVGYSIIQRQVDILAYNAEMLDLTSSQRALSEEALRLASEPSINTARLNEVLKKIDDAQAQLQDVPHASDNTASLLRSLEPSLNQVSASGHTLIASPEGEDVAEVRSLMASAQAEFKSGMERTTSSLEQDSADRVDFTRKTLATLLLASVALLVSAGGLVAGPLRGRLFVTLSQLEERARELGVVRGELLKAHGELKERHVRLRRAFDESTNVNEYLVVASSRFEELFHGVPFACFSVDSSGTIFEWNEAASDLFDVPAHRTVQQAVYGLIFGPSNDALLESLIARAFNGENIWNVEVNLPPGNRRAS